MLSNITEKPKKFQQIYSTAEELFQKYGFRRVTIEEICQKASVSKMTFYKYFPNKEELIKCMIGMWFSESERIFEQIKTMDKPFNEKIKLLLRLKEEYSAKMSMEFLLDYLNPEQELGAYIKNLYTRSMGLFIDFIREAQANGEVRRDIKPEFIIAIINKLLEMANDKEFLKLYSSVSDFSLEINNFIYCGIQPLEKVLK